MEPPTFKCFIIKFCGNFCDRNTYLYWRGIRINWGIIFSTNFKYFLLCLPIVLWLYIKFKIFLVSRTNTDFLVIIVRPISNKLDRAIHWISYRDAVLINLTVFLRLFTKFHVLEFLMYVWMRKLGIPVFGLVLKFSLPSYIKWYFRSSKVY